jgi:hypothetical protein
MNRRINGYHHHRMQPSRPNIKSHVVMGLGLLPQVMLYSNVQPIFSFWIYFAHELKEFGSFDF